MSGEIKSLTGLRGLAILFVVLSHTSKAGFKLHDGLDFSGAGRYGVFMFFVLSAYLLTKQFLDVTKPLNFPKHVMIYLIRRVLRIYPLYITALLTYFFNIFGHTIWSFDARDLVSNIFLLDGIGVFWAIPVEFQYYFFIPLIAYFLLKNFDGFINVSIISLALITLLSVFIEPQYKPNVLPFLGVFYMGSYLAYIQKNFETATAVLTDEHKKKISFFMNILSMIALCAFIVLIPEFFGYIVNDKVPIGYFHHHFVLLGILSSLLILTTINSDGLVSRLLCGRLFCFIGKISFSLYLGHYLIIAALAKYNHLFTPLFSFVLFFIIAIPLSYLSFRVIEKPLFDLRHKIVIS